MNNDVCSSQTFAIMCGEHKSCLTPLSVRNNPRYATPEHKESYTERKRRMARRRKAKQRALAWQALHMANSQETSRPKKMLRLMGKTFEVFEMDDTEQSISIPFCTHNSPEHVGAEDPSKDIGHTGCKEEEMEEALATAALERDLEQSTSAPLPMCNSKSWTPPESPKFTPTGPRYDTPESSETSSERRRRIARRRQAKSRMKRRVLAAEFCGPLGDPS